MFTKIKFKGDIIMKVKQVVKIVSLLIPLLSATCALVSDSVDTVTKIKSLKGGAKL